MFSKFNILFVLFCLLNSCLPKKGANNIVISSKENPKSKIPVWVSKKSTYKSSYTKLFDLVHTKLEVKFDWTKMQMKGLATLKLSPWFYSQNTLVLDAKGFEVHSIKLLTTTSTLPLTYEYDKLKLTIHLDRTYNKSEIVQLIIDYTAKPEELPKGGSSAITSDKGLYFIKPDETDSLKPYQIWTQGETESASCWFPTIDATNQKSSQEMYITVDSKYKTVSNGLLISSVLNKDSTRTDYWKQDLPHAPYLFMMVVGDFAVLKDKWQDKEVAYYVEPKYAPYAKGVFGNTPEMLEFFSKKLNFRFPWDKYSQIVVRDYVSGAMENTSASIFMDALQINHREQLDKNWDGIVAHELFHHWFGDLVTCESWANLPLNESFANYAEYLWAEHKYGKDAADFHLQDELMQYMAESSSKQEPLIRFNNTSKDDMFDSHSYAKGGCVLHMLRKYVGDEAFFTSLSNYLTKNQFKEVEIHQLRLAFEEVVGEDLNWFFNQYFLSPGHVELVVEDTYSNGKLKIKVLQMQDSLYTPIYKMPLKVDVWSNNIKSTLSIVVNNEFEEFEFDMNNAPDLVDFDADKQLVGTIRHDKTVDKLIFQYKNATNYLSRYESLSKLGSSMDKENVRDLVLSAMDDSFWNLRELAALNWSFYKGEDTLSCRDKIISLALNDPKSDVRASCIHILGAKSGKYKDVFEKGLNDSSYAVVAASLSASIRNNIQNLPELLNRFDNEKNGTIILAIADYYATLGKDQHFNWFKKNSQTLTGRDSYYFITHFNKYLKKSSLETRKMGSQVLCQIASLNSFLWTRYAGYKALGDHLDLEGILDKRSKIKANERNPKLIERYKNMK